MKDQKFPAQISSTTPHRKCPSDSASSPSPNHYKDFFRFGEKMVAAGILLWYAVPVETFPYSDVNWCPKISLLGDESDARH